MPSSRIWHCVALVRTDVSEEHIASIIRVERISELETLVITSNWTPLWRNCVSLNRCFGGIHHLCRLVVIVPGYRPRAQGFNSLALPDFLKCSRSGMGSTHLREENWGATFFFIIPFYLSPVQVHSTNCVKIFTMACRRGLSSALLKLIGPL
jgi:hypothetical protein